MRFYEILVSIALFSWQQTLKFHYISSHILAGTETGFLPSFPLLVKLSKYFAYSQGHLTFMENPLVRIAAKFQYKIPSLRTDSRFTDTISWSQGRPHRKT